LDNNSFKIETSETEAVETGTEETQILISAVSDAADPRQRLFLRQKMLLDTFLERGAINQAQYDKSLGDLILKMGISDVNQKSDN